MWVAQLMGFPEWWLDLTYDFALPDVASPSANGKNQEQ
jgi:hypothetical protein